MAKKLNLPQAVNVPIAEIKNNPSNPRFIRDDKFEKLVNSIKTAPWMLALRPIIVNSDMVVLGGNMRLRACREAGLMEVPILRAKDLTQDQQREFIIKDNVGFGEWDWELIANDWDADELEEWGLDTPDNWDEGNEEGEGGGQEEHGTLTDRYVVPPFTIMDTRQGYWQERKKYWLQITGDLSESRDGEFGTVSGGSDTMFAAINNGTSNFDPVLAEAIYTWFIPTKIKNGILDPFGGEQTKGVVAGEMDLPYKAVEFRQEQVDINKGKTKQYSAVDYKCGDSNNIHKLIKERGFDLCFTSPPYYDLEVYSKEDMSALGTYAEFMAQYKNIFTHCFNMLADDRFLVVKIGEIRDKKTGEYRNFVGDNISIMREIGFKYYNEITLVNSFGTAPMRANNAMKARKLVKVHQNVLVFYKGDLKTIAKNYPPLDFKADEQD